MKAVFTVLLVCATVFGFEGRIRISGDIIGEPRMVTVKELESIALSGNGTLKETQTAVIDKKNISSFSGIPLTEVIKKYTAQNIKRVTFKAWDRYSITMDMDKINKFSPIVVTREFGKQIPYEERGPVRIVTPIVQNKPDQLKDRVQIFAVKEIIFYK